MSKDREKLERVMRTIQQYIRWMPESEFPEVVLVLNNLLAVAEGKASLCASFPPSEQGPWSVDSLREVLRSRRAAALAKPPGSAPEKPYRVTVMEMGGYGEDFETLEAALLYAGTQADAIEADDGRKMQCDGIVCEREDTGESWALRNENGYLWEVE